MASKEELEARIVELTQECEKAKSYQRLNLLLLSGLEAMLSSESREEIFEKFFDFFGDIIPYQYGLLLKHCEDGLFHCVASNLDSGLDSQLYDCPLPSCTELESCLAGKTLSVNNNQLLQAWDNSEFDFHTKIRSLLISPILIGQKHYVLLLSAESEHVFDRDMEDLVAQFSAFAASTLVRVEARKLLLETEELRRKQAETEKNLLSSEKLAALGQLAAGVAHEINNPLGFILSNISTLKKYFGSIQKLFAAYEELTQELREYPLWKNHNVVIDELKEELDIQFIMEDTNELLNDTTEGANRVRDIVAGLKKFAHPNNDELQVASIQEILDSTLKLAWNELKYNCMIEKVYSPSPALIMCRPSQLSQVFLNLLINASHAIGTEQQGVISLTVKVLPRHVEVIVADNGCGIAQENLQKIFEPFFTTKGVGSGTGLGLSLSYNIIDQHNGTVKVESELGKGTQFQLSFPRAAGQGI
ncbi:ATP-binding protein [Balneatrix alpica]|uniref:ATP-binding protein n=1 Tax=Balneatrix alpica TaxID=75684 RepID=UPI002739E221|nr:ATP-binding protein [Balneatrix alpica]